MRRNNKAKERRIFWCVEYCQGCGIAIDNGHALCADCKRKLPRGASCNACPWEKQCHARLAQLYWVICERPDVTDIERIKAVYGQAAMYV
ncbi:hypothetical protein C4588_04110 [Candidatus Parcubacteria bacterium]|jgi:hypothetical protein|nr:MAG: hypothetical protein C4588_04110 [Candidatus Parcubacteria bacterium]